MPPPVQKFRIYAPSHAFGRRDRLNGSRRGGTYFLSCAKEEYPGMAKPFPWKRATLRLFCHAIHHQRGHSDSGKRPPLPLAAR